MATPSGIKWEYVFIYLSQLCTLHYWEKKSLKHRSTQSLRRSRTGCALHKHTQRVVTQFQRNSSVWFQGVFYGVELQLEHPALSEDCGVAALVDACVQDVLILKTTDTSTFPRVTGSTVKALAEGRRSERQLEKLLDSTNGWQNTVKTSSMSS